MLITDEMSDVTSSIEVFLLPPNVSEDFITDFFENSKRSGGGDVEDVSYDEKTNTAIITFQDPAGYFQYFYSLIHETAINQNYDKIQRCLRMLYYCQRHVFFKPQ